MSVLHGSVVARGVRSERLGDADNVVSPIVRVGISGVTCGSSKCEGGVPEKVLPRADAPPISEGEVRGRGDTPA